MRNDKPFIYKIFRVTLIVASAVVILLVAIFAAKFLLETPMYRMFDGISVLDVLNMVMVLFAIICNIVAWFHAIGGGIVSLIPIGVYTLVESVQMGIYTASAMNYIMLGLSLLFIVQGLVKRHLEIDRMDIILGPRVSKHEGPDLTNLNL